MSTESYAQLLTKLSLMAGNISKNQAQLANIGIAPADVAALEAFITELNALNAEQESLKADLKSKTNEMQIKVAAAKAKYAALSKRIKIILPQEAWVAYGITASK